MLTLVERFYSKISIEENGCWIWKGSLDRDGYGQLGEGKYRKHKSHRLSYQVHLGQIPKDLCVLHKCDRPNCVNPDHLFLGTQQDNMRDKSLKGRTAKGESQGSSKLTRSERDLIFIDPRPQTAIAKDFGISQTQVSRIKTRKHWNIGEWNDL